MDNLVQLILSTLLAIVSPGQSIYSQVPIKYCDDVCQTKPLCADPTWRCRPPRFNGQLYSRYLTEYNKTLPTDQAMAEAKKRSYTRPETYKEGLVRYTVAARAIAEVATEMTLTECKRQCTDETCHKTCSSNATWKGSRKELALMIAVVVSQEAGVRADVHGGSGPAGRGDCSYQDPEGKPAAPTAKNARIIPGSCRSVCLGQINIGNGKTPQGWTAEDITGIDLASTKRCLTATAYVLSRSRAYCARSLKSKNWAKSTFAAYGSGNSCTINQKKLVNINGAKITHYAYQVKDESGKLATVWAVVPPDNATNRKPLESPWPARRSQLFWQYMRTPKPLDPKINEISQETDFINLVDKLIQSQDKIEWMLPLTNEI